MKLYMIGALLGVIIGIASINSKNIKKIEIENDIHAATLIAIVVCLTVQSWITVINFIIKRFKKKKTNEEIEKFETALIKVDDTIRRLFKRG